MTSSSAVNGGASLPQQRTRSLRFGSVPSLPAWAGPSAGSVLWHRHTCSHPQACHRHAVSRRDSHPSGRTSRFRPGSAPVTPCRPKAINRACGAPHGWRPVSPRLGDGGTRGNIHLRARTQRLGSRPATGSGSWRRCRTPAVNGGILSLKKIVERRTWRITSLKRRCARGSDGFQAPESQDDMYTCLAGILTRRMYRCLRTLAIHVSQKQTGQ